jgi:predicted HicB family RNase H-like nuclease
MGTKKPKRRVNVPIKVRPKTRKRLEQMAAAANESLCGFASEKLEMFVEAHDRALVDRGAR